MLSGTLASALSTAALAAFGALEKGEPLAPTNSTSHWLWGEEAYQQHELSLKHTAVGYATHHGSAVFWAYVFERWIEYSGHRAPSQIVRDSVGMAAVTAFIDYQLTPRRLRPGFEKHLSLASMCGVYAALGAGLAVGALLNRRQDRRVEKLLRLQ